MNKEQQKDEVILIVKEAINANTEQHFVDDDTVYIDGNDIDHIAEQVADEVYNAGCHKLPEGAVVLTKEECEHKVILDEDHFERALNYEREKVRKETAKEILNRINEYNLNYNWDLKEEFIKLCKDYDVEVEDD